MSKRNINSFDPFFGDLSQGQISSSVFEERSKSVPHENRFSTVAENISELENSRNLTKTEDFQS